MIDLSTDLGIDFKEWLIKDSEACDSFELNPKCGEALYFIGPQHETVKWEDICYLMQYELIKAFGRSEGYFINLITSQDIFPPMYAVDIITEQRRHSYLGAEEGYTYKEAMYASVKQFKNLYNGNIKT